MGRERGTPQMGKGYPDVTHNGESECTPVHSLSDPHSFQNCHNAWKEGENGDCLL